MNKIKTIKIKNEDGSINEESYTIAVDSINVDMKNGKDLQDTVGDVNVDEDGNIAEQLKKKIDKIYIEDNLNSTRIDKALSANQGRVLNNILNKKPYYFNNVIEMKSNNKLKVGDCIITLGYYSKNDGGGAKYLIRNKVETDVEDNGSIHFIGSDLIAELIVENDIIPEIFGAKGNGVVDDSTSIENMVNYANKYNKKIVFSKKTYCISKSFYIKAGISIDGNFATIIPLASNNYINGFIFLLNSKNATTWFEEYKGDCNIRNIIFNNINEIQNIKAFYLAENNIDFFQIKTIRFYQFIKTASVYLDNVSFRKITCAYNYGTDYMMYKGGQGDGILFDECHFVSSDDGLNNKGIFLNNSWGATIQNIINGHHEFSSCINTTIQNCHFERGSLLLKNSIINVKNSYFWKIDGIVPITIVDTDKSQNYGNYNINQNYVLEQLIFELRYATYNYYIDTVDINLSNIMQDVIIKDCFRRAEPRGGALTQCTLTGLMLELATVGKKIVPYSNFKVKSRTIITNEKILHSGLFTNAEYLLSSISETDKVNANFNHSQYFYKLQNLLDVEKLIGSVSQEKSITKTLATKGNIINIGSMADINTTIRLYRGTSSDNYSQYVDIPYPRNKVLIDNGSTVNGFEWKDFLENNIPTLTYCEFIEKDNNYQGNVKCKLENAPSRGNWLKNDIVINSNPSINESIGWVCVESGTPGVRKAFGNIE